MKPLSTLLTAAALLASAGLAPAEPARSLNDARSQINSGTWSGITLIEAKPKTAKAEPPAGAASAATAPVAPAPATAPAPAAAATAGTSAKATDTATASPAGQTAAPAAPIAVAPAPVAPVAPVAPAAPEATPTATAPAPAASSPSVAERLRAVLGPPSGVPMNQATRLDSPDRGIVLPTGAASAATGAAK